MSLYNGTRYATKRGAQDAEAAMREDHHVVCDTIAGTPANEADDSLITTWPEMGWGPSGTSLEALRDTRLSASSDRMARSCWRLQPQQPFPDHPLRTIHPDGMRS